MDDYIRSEAARLPSGTAARFMAALDAMDGATEPLEGDTTNVPIQADQPTKTLEAPQDQHDRSEIVYAAQLAETVTITISREDAEWWASDDDHIHAFAWGPVDKAIRAALEGER
jgi:hypothetical protein